MIRFLLTRAWIRPNEPGQDGETPLHRAIRYGHTAGVIALVADQRVNVNATTPTGWTPLRSAIEYNNIPAFDAIMARDDIDLSYRVGTTGWTYLHAARRNPYALRALLQTGTTDVNARNAKGMTVLHLAVWSADIEVREILLSQPDIDIKSKDSFGFSALHRALCAKNTGFAERLIELPQTDINLLTLKGNSPIYFAITNDLPGCVRALCRRADFDVRLGSRPENGRARSPLELATSYRRVEIIEILLECPGIKLKKKKYGLKHAIQIAKTNGFSDCLQILKDSRQKSKGQKESFFARLGTRSKASALSTSRKNPVSG
jgi:ankyrin repeat protein